MLKRTFKLLLFAALSTVVLVVGVWGYARYVEPRWVEETHWQLHAPHWQGQPVKLAVLSDLHARSGDGASLDALVQRILAGKPDAVLLLGDYINERHLGDSMPVETLGHHLAPLAAVPCFAVLGNHDYSYGARAIRTMLQSFGAQVMEGKLSTLSAGGSTLYLAGMRCQCCFHTPGTLPSVPHTGEVPATCLMLTHSPAGAHVVPEGTTATLCGHTHGGQVCLPGGIPLVRPDGRVAWKEMKGALLIDGRPVYVVRGLGMSGPPYRFCCRPELLWVEVKKRGAESTPPTQRSEDCAEQR